MQFYRNQFGIGVLRLHYSADPAKGEGPTTNVPEINMDLSKWAHGEFGKMTDPNAYLREYEIKAEATLGRQIFNLDAEATIEDSYPLPPEFTRRMSLDPHPSVPHAFLWSATNRWGERIYYRELWPSKACFRFDQNGNLSGKAGPCPDDEPIITIKDYVEVIKYLESRENPENEYAGQRFDETILTRVIDYAARGFGKGTNDDASQPNFQQRYESYMVMPQLRVTCPMFEDAKKDLAVGFEMVNAGLKVKMVEDQHNPGKLRKWSPIRIFGDRCPELVYQLKNNRRQILTPQQAQVKDPTGKIVEVRKHQTDNLRYIEMSNPIFIEPQSVRSSWRPQHEGIAY